MRKFQLLITGAVILLDRISKLLVLQHIPPVHEISILPGFFQLSHWENTGAAFSIFADSSSPWRTPALVAFSITAVLVICFLLWKHGAVLDSTSVCYCLILGGASGNLWDRLTKATITDFLDFYIGDHHWPPFNLADSAIVIGAAILIAKVMSPEHEKAAR